MAMLLLKKGKKDYRAPRVFAKSIEHTTTCTTPVPNRERDSRPGKKEIHIIDSTLALYQAYSAH
jgi:hypothetical protein